MEGFKGKKMEGSIQIEGRRHIISKEWQSLELFEMLISRIAFEKYHRRKKDHKYCQEKQAIFKNNLYLLLSLLISSCELSRSCFIDFLVFPYISFPCL